MVGELRRILTHIGTDLAQHGIRWAIRRAVSDRVCRVCMGAGKLYGSPCYACDGDGRVTAFRARQIKRLRRALRERRGR